MILAILNYNGKDTLKESVESVLQQTLKPDRFVVIDNASTDRSRQIAIKMGIEVIDADNRHQFITGLNTAVRLNRDLLFFMQNDVILDKNCLKEMLKVTSLWDRYTTNFIAQPVIYQTNGEIDNAGMDIRWPGYGFRRHTKWFNNEFDNIWKSCGLVTTICFLTNNKTIFYDEQFSPAYYEDIDFKLRTPHFTHLLIPIAKAVHKGNHTFSKTLKKKEISEICHQNRIKLINKNFRGFNKWTRLIAVQILDFLAAIRFLKMN